MAPTPSVKIIKSFTYNGSTRSFSNRYHFNGGTPADPTHWHTLMDNVVNAEKACYASGVTITDAIGYNAGSDLPIASKSYSTAGTYTVTSQDVKAPGDAAFLMRWSTSARTAKNHPVYLFSYLHGIYLDHTADAGRVAQTQRTAINGYGEAWQAGFSDGTNTYVRAGPNGATGSYDDRTDPFYVTHRDFPR